MENKEDEGKNLEKIGKKGNIDRINQAKVCPELGTAQPKLVSNYS